MSSTASSTLTDPPVLALELEASWPAPGLLALWLACLVAAIAAASLLSWPMKAGFTAIILLSGIGLLEGQLFSLSGRALKRATLQPDGQWLLTDGRGRQWAAALDPGSRSLAGVAFLRWRSAQGRHWALVTGSKANRDALRRLRVRLRFS